MAFGAFAPVAAAVSAAFVAPLAMAQQDAVPLPPLLEAVRNGDVSAVSAYLEQDAARVVNVTWERNWMPLHVALRNDQPEVARLLIENGAPVNTQPEGDFWGTPIHFAASGGDISMVRLLVEAGADVNIKNGYEQLPLNRAEEECYGDVVEFLWQSGTIVPDNFDTKITPLHTAVANDDMEQARLLISEGADLDALTRLQISPLYLAARNNRFALVKLLVEAGADLSVVNEQLSSEEFGVKLPKNSKRQSCN